MRFAPKIVKSAIFCSRYSNTTSCSYSFSHTKNSKSCSKNNVEEEKKTNLMKTILPNSILRFGKQQTLQSFLLVLLRPTLCTSTVNVFSVFIQIQINAKKSFTMSKLIANAIITVTRPLADGPKKNCGHSKKLYNGKFLTRFKSRLDSYPWKWRVMWVIGTRKSPIFPHRHDVLHGIWHQIPKNVKVQ